MRGPSPAPSRSRRACYRIPLPLPNDGLRAVNVYALVHGADLLLIDSGWAIPGARAVLDQALAALGATAGDVRRILVTHVHRDHYTQAIYLRREFGVPVSLGIGDRESLAISMDAGSGAAAEPARLPAPARRRRHRRPGRPACRAPATRTRPAGRRPTSGCATARSSRTAAGPWTWWPRPATPAATSCSTTPAAGCCSRATTCCRPSRRRSGSSRCSSDDPLGAFLGSLALIRSRPDARLLPAHGPVTDSAHARVDELIAHHGRRLDEAEAVIRGGAQTAREAAARLKWTRRERTLDELDPFNQMLAVTETAAHLQLLAAQGRVTRHEAGGLRYYQPA